MSDGKMTGHSDLPWGVNERAALLKCAEVLRELMKACSVHEVSDSAKSGERYDKAMDNAMAALSAYEKAKENGN
jgi:hypothetical protein